MLLATGVGLLMLGTALFVMIAVRAAPNALQPAVVAMWAIGGVLVVGALVARRIERAKALAPQPPRFVWFPSTGGAYLNVADEYEAPTHENVTSVPPREAEAQWSGRVFDHIEWRRFEAVCEALFAQAGFETKTQSHGADGGVDIWLHSRHAEGPAAVVQCKHWHEQPVGVKPVREFFGVMTSHRLRHGTFATSSWFTDDALRFAKQNGIHTLDREGLLALIARRSPEQQQLLLEVAYEGEYWRPTCARCGIKMVERIQSKTRDAFWGCTNYPRCRATLPKRS